MCGRFALHSLVSDVAAFIGLPLLPYDNFPASYNISPGQAIPNLQRRRREPSFETYRWGFVPEWAPPEGLKQRPINARGEPVATSPMFSAAFRQHRSIIPADGFYEWRREGSTKQPYYVRRRDGKPLLFAGLYAPWRAVPDAPLTCAIITMAANGTLRPIHERMPVVIPRAGVDAWLDPQALPAQVRELLRPAPDGLLEAYPVSARVNSPTNDGEELIRPLDPIQP